MLKTFLVGLAASTLLCAADNLSVDALTRKALERELKNMKLFDPQRHLIIQGAVPLSPPPCAVPLKELRVNRRTDPGMSFPTRKSATPKSFDAIAHPPSVPACPRN